MAKPNYSFEKRQRELAKKKKKEEKLQEKAARKNTGPGTGDHPPEPTESAAPADAPVENKVVPCHRGHDAPRPAVLTLERAASRPRSACGGPLRARRQSRPDRHHRAG